MTPTGTDHLHIHGRHDYLTKTIIGVFYEVYNELDFDFLESVYRESMRVALGQAGLRVDAEVPISVIFRGQLVGAFRADLIVNEAVLLELKTCDTLAQERQSQTLNYLRAAKIEVALLMNFGPVPRFKRSVMDNEIKRPSRKSVQSVSIGAKQLEDATEVPL